MAHTPGPWDAKTRDQWEGGYDFFSGPDGAFTFMADVEPEDIPIINAAPKLLAVAKLASQLASIASDWNLDEVEIDGEMVGIYALKAIFDVAISEAEGKP